MFLKEQLVYILVCYTKKGVGGNPNAPCASLIWTYAKNGKTYKGCANPDKASGGNWCPTEVNEKGIYEPKSMKWGYCNTNCRIDGGKNHFIIE